MDEMTFALLERINSLSDRIAALERQERVIDDTAATANALVRRDGSGNINAALGTFSSGVAVPKSSGTALFAIDAGNTGSTFTLANAATATPFGTPASGGNFSGLILIYETTAGSSALFMCGGATTVLVSESVAGTYSNTSGTANRINLYYGPASTYTFTVQNNSGGSRTIGLMALRSRPGA